MHPSRDTRTSPGSLGHTRLEMFRWWERARCQRYRWVGDNNDRTRGIESQSRSEEDPKPFGIPEDRWDRARIHYSAEEHRLLDRGKHRLGRRRTWLGRTAGESWWTVELSGPPD